MQPRSERQKILWAVFLSLLLHLVVGVSIASFGDKLQPSLPEDEKPVELTIVDVAPMPTPPTGPKNTPFIDTTEQTETKEEPKEKTFESNANSIAASELPALGIAPIPTQEGKELPTMDLKNRQHSLDGGGRASAARFAPGAGAKHNAAGNATTDTTDPHAIAQRHASFYAPADTNPDTDTDRRFIGNVPRQSAADGAHARARERGQFSFPKGSTSTSVAPACIVGVSTRASTRANGWEHFEAGSFIGKRRRHTAWPL